MIKVQDILDYSKPHKNMMEGARHTIIFDDNVELSIENNDDVIGYMNGDDVEKFVNKVFPKGFQVL
jgi:hypothetical protein